MSVKSVLYFIMHEKMFFFVVKHNVDNHNYILILRKLLESFSKSYLKKQLEIILCKTTIFQCYLISKMPVMST